MVGYSSNIKDIFDIISTSLKTQAETERENKMTYSQAMFFSQFANQIGFDSAISNNVHWRMKPGGIFVKGRPAQVEKG